MRTCSGGLCELGPKPGLVGRSGRPTWRRHSPSFRGGSWTGKELFLWTTCSRREQRAMHVLRHCGATVQGRFAFGPLLAGSKMVNMPVTSEKIRFPRSATSGCRMYRGYQGDLDAPAL